MTVTELTDADIASRIRAARRCGVCGELAAGGLCWEDRDELGRMLDPGYAGDWRLGRPASIPQLWARLDPTPGRAGEQGRRAPGFRSTPPLNLDAVVMRDRRSSPVPVVDIWYELVPGTNRENYHEPHYEDEGAARSVEASVAALAGRAWTDLGYRDLWKRLDAGRGYGWHAPPERTVEQHCAWLYARLDVLVARGNAAPIHRDLSDLQAQLRGPAGDPRDKSVADCTGWVHDRDTGDKVACGAPLFMPPPDPGVEAGPADPPILDPRKPAIRCDRCDRPYSLLMLLRQQIGDERKAS